MTRFSMVLVVALCLTIFAFPETTAQLSRNFYSQTCPNVEQIVRNVVQMKVKETFAEKDYPDNISLAGDGFDVVIQAKKDYPDNISLAGDGCDVVIQAKKALDANPRCRNKVSCADILSLGARDVVVVAGGPFYEVELGRFDGLVSTASSVKGNLLGPSDNVNKLNALFMKNNLTQEDMIALSAAHTLGFAHCSKVFNKIYNFNSTISVDPTLNMTYGKELQMACPKNVDPRIAINMDPVTPRTFDNVYYKNLQQGKGLFTSDQVLYTDGRSRPTVNAWAKDSQAFNRAFVTAMTKLGRVGVKNSHNGNIRHDCGAFN
ncbi:unnamed protein product [Eruca vesicaria subsp. sativa]|uniref:Peroxidase n=1 Tax=Eruca vesicaria subsp. sativa TaxID=29727 RepID=A0ABC8JPE1_ERUVS|nr:unnamed protein product [Eruca vesicaria subsp. sativa]